MVELSNKRRPLRVKESTQGGEGSSYPQVQVILLCQLRSRLRAQENKAKD